MPAGPLDGQALAALGATGVDDSAPGAGLHAYTKTVGAFATGNGRLESAFHGKKLKKSVDASTR